ncbi:membrane protein [Helicobacter pylori]|nr:membrane protein [Helicobacter pylori]
MKPKIELRVIALLVVRSLEKIFLVIFMLSLGFIKFRFH